MLPLESIVGLSGFQAKYPERYFLRRNIIQPPDELLQMIFPWIEGWITKFESRDESVEHDLAAIYFLKWLQFIRKVIVQDAVELMQIYPEHPLFSYPLFANDLFVRYRDQLLTRMEQTLPPQQSDLRVRILQFIPQNIYG